MEWYEKLKFARTVLGLTLREAEEKIGVSNAYLSQVETGKIKDPGFFTMLKIINCYNVDIKEFSPNNKIQPDQNIGGLSMKTCSQCGVKHLHGTMYHKCFGR